MNASWVKFTQIQASMYGGMWALSESGELWHFNRYNEWEKVPSPMSDHEKIMQPIPEDNRARPAIPGPKNVTL